jgi:hypothetical protein
MRTLLLALAASVLLPACQNRSLFSGAGGTEGGTTTGGGARPARGGEVSLTAKDLAPVDAYVAAGGASGAPNARWILGDEVVIEASREYFAQAVSITARTGAVHRNDETRPDETVTTLTYMMGKYQSGVENNPRVLIGTGITVSARKTLVVRLVRTTDPSVPVRLRITANGDASRGRKDKVEERAPTLQMGGALRWNGSAYVWTPIG